MHAPAEPDFMNVGAPMRVALFIDSDVFAGTERHMVELAGALKVQASLVVSIACPSASPLNRLARDLGLETIPVEKRGLVDVPAILLLRKLLATGRLDLIHAHNGRTALSAAVARRFAGRGSVVATQHFIDPAHAGRVGLSAGFSRMAHRWVQRQTDQYIAVSQAAQKAMIEREGEGVLLYLAQEGRGIGLLNKLRAYKLQEEGLDTVEANEKLGFPMDLRDYGLGAQILFDLGVRQLLLLTNNPKKVVGLAGYGLKIVETVPIRIEANVHNKAYLRTKRNKMGHTI